MDSVKFVPPGGHRACLSCSAAKAKCVFSDDAEVISGDTLGFITGGPDDFINASAADMQPSQPNSGLDGTPAIPRCQRCERLNRDCLLPTRPRKKRRVGALKPGMRAASASASSNAFSTSTFSTSTFSVAPQNNHNHNRNHHNQNLAQKSSLSNLSTTSSLDPAILHAHPPRMPSMPNMRSSMTPARQSKSRQNTPKRSPVTPNSFPYHLQQIPPISSIIPDNSGSTTPQPQSHMAQSQQQQQQQQQQQPQQPQQQHLQFPQLPPSHTQNMQTMQTMHMSSAMSTTTTTMQSFMPASPGAAARAANMAAAPLTIDPSRLRPHGSPSIAHITPPRQYQTIPPPSQIQPQQPLPLPTPHAPQASQASQAGQAPQVGGPTTADQTPASAAGPGAGVGVAPPQISALSQPGPQNPLQIVIDSVFSMDEREAEETLRFYRDAYSSFNPYMEPPPVSMRVAELQAQKPLVWIGIVFVTSFHDFERQNKLGRAMIYYLSDKMYQNNVKTLELLQGLLVFLNWFIAQNFVLPQFTNLIHMAMALVTDLGLNKLEFSKTIARSPLDQYVAKTIHGPGLRAPDEGHTLEERRALAGGFCLSHAMSDSIIMVTPLHYSLQLEDTCRFFEATYLRKKSASPGGPYSLSAAAAPIAASTIADYHLAITVRLYHLIGRVLQVQRDADLCGGRFAVPVRQHIDNFTAELTRLWSGLPQETQSDFKIQLLYYTAEIYIYELSLSTQTTPFKANSTPSRESDDGSSSVSVSAPTQNHLQSDHPHQYPQEADIPLPIRCYLSVKQFFDIFLTLPVNLYHQFPVTLFTQLVHADLTLAKLTAFFRGNTQPLGVPEGVKLPLFTETIEAVASRFARVRTVPHPLGYAVRNIIYDAFAARLRSFKMLDLAGKRKHAKLAAMKAARVAANQQQAKRPAHPAPPPPSDVLSINSLIGNVPHASEGMHNTDQAQPASSSSPSAAPATYPSVEMDVVHDDLRDLPDSPDLMDNIVVDDAMVTGAADLDEMMEISGGSDDMDEQAEWWAWFGNLQSSLMGPPRGSTAPGSTVGGAPGAGAGAGAGAAAAPAPAQAPAPAPAQAPDPDSDPAAPASASTTGPVLPVPAPSSQFGPSYGGYGSGLPGGPLTAVTPGTASGSYGLTVPSFGMAERRRGPGSVTSIDSLLNNRDLEPNLDIYMLHRGM